MTVLIGPHFVLLSHCLLVYKFKLLVLVLFLSITYLIILITKLEVALCFPITLVTSEIVRIRKTNNSLGSLIILSRWRRSSNTWR